MLEVIDENRIILNIEFNNLEDSIGFVEKYIKKSRKIEEVSLIYDELNNKSKKLKRVLYYQKPFFMYKCVKNIKNNIEIKGIYLNITYIYSRGR